MINPVEISNKTNIYLSKTFQEKNANNNMSDFTRYDGKSTLVLLSKITVIKRKER